MSWWIKKKLTVVLTSNTWLFTDEHLDFRKHLTYIEAKLARAVGVLFKCKACFSTKILRMQYFSLMYPHLTHSIIAWGSSFTCDVKKIEVLQNKAMRAIANAKFKQKLLPLYHQFDILPLKQIYALQLRKFMHKPSTSSLPLPISHLSSQVQLRHSYSTRNSCNLSLACYSSSKLQSSFVYKSIKLWNATPPLIRKYSFKKFNGELRKLLASKQLSL